MQFSSSRSLSHGTVKGRYIYFFSVTGALSGGGDLISLLSYSSFRSSRPCPIVSSRGRGGDSAYEGGGDARLKV